MRITPRGEEVKAVVDLLESDGFDSADKMAKAVIKEVADMLAMREWFALTHIWENGSKGLNFGPYGSKAEVKKAAEAIGGGSYMAIPLHSPGKLQANYEGKKWKGYCQSCEHSPALHLADGSSRGKCGLSYCDCPKYQK